MQYNMTSDTLSCTARGLTFELLEVTQPVLENAESDAAQPFGCIAVAQETTEVSLFGGNGSDGGKPLQWLCCVSSSHQWLISVKNTDYSCLIKPLNCIHSYVLWKDLECF